MSRSIASIASLLSAPARLKNTAATRSSIRAAALQRLDRIGEGGRRRIVRDRGDFGALLRERDVEGGAEMLGRDRRERRRLEGAGPGFEKGIGGVR